MSLLSDSTLCCIFYIFVLWCVFRLLRFLYTNFLRKRQNLLIRYGERSWVLVTGATDGLGRSYCEQFAKEGFNILLVSRSLDKLKTTQQELQNTYKNIDVHYIQFDFNEKTSLEDYQNAFGKLTETNDISIVVNNVGTYEEGYFARVKLEDHMKLINVNVVPQTILTKLFSVYLSGRKKRSAVIDISSFTSIMPLPIFSIYAATKSFSYYLSRALAEEYKNYNIDFLAVRLLFAATKLSKKKANGWAVITADQSVEGVLNDLGYENETFGHWVHKVQAFLFSLVPKCLIYPAMRIVFRMNRKPKIKDQ